MRKKKWNVRHKLQDNLKFDVRPRTTRISLSGARCNDDKLVQCKDISGDNACGVVVAISLKIRLSFGKEKYNRSRMMLNPKLYH